MLRSEFAAKLEMTIGYLFIRGVTNISVTEFGNISLRPFKAPT